MFLLGMVLAACAPRKPVPVSDLSTSAKPAEVIRIVRPGDTLYSVAWAAGVDYRQLARWNGLEEPYVIHPGQQLTLSLRQNTARVPTNTVKTRKLISTQGVITRKPISAEPLEPVRKKTESAVKPKSPGKTTAASAKKSTKPAKRKNSQPPATGKSPWGWPVNGKVVRRFSTSKGNKGIDIAVASGTPVRASKGGVVVYAGSGLRGYGQLVIVKHNDEFLSAYGHNRKLLVEEGDQIRSGQVIAESGTTAGATGQLHFEIRRNGNPVDPLKYLG